MSKGQQSRAGTVGGKLFTQVSTPENSGPKTRLKDCPSTVHSFAPPFFVGWFSCVDKGLTDVPLLYAPELWIPNAMNSW